MRSLPLPFALDSDDTALQLFRGLALQKACNQRLKPPRGICERADLHIKTVKISKDLSNSGLH